jgi:hypothetical protein
MASRQASQSSDDAACGHRACSRDHASRIPRHAALLPRRRVQNLAMQPLQRPAVLHEATGEIVEQFGMRRRFAEIAELARRIDQTATEVMLPHAIHDHARGQRRGVFHDGLRQFEATASGVELARQAGLDGKADRKRRGTRSPRSFGLPRFMSSRSRAMPIL